MYIPVNLYLNTCDVLPASCAYFAECAQHRATASTSYRSQNGKKPILSARRKENKVYCLSVRQGIFHNEKGRQDLSRFKDINAGRKVEKRGHPLTKVFK